MQKKTNRRRRSTGKPKPATRRRRRTRKKKSLLSELVTEKTAQGGFRNVASGAIGGGAAYLVDSILPDDMPTMNRIMWGTLAAFGASTVAKMPTVGAGMAGVAGFRLAEELTADKGIAENSEAIYAAQTEELPDVLDQYGRPMMLAEDGQFYLQEDSSPTDYFPSYQSNYANY